MSCRIHDNWKYPQKIPDEGEGRLLDDDRPNSCRKILRDSVPNDAFGTALSHFDGCDNG